MNVILNFLSCLKTKEWTSIPVQVLKPLNKKSEVKIIFNIQVIWHIYMCSKIFVSLHNNLFQLYFGDLWVFFFFQNQVGQIMIVNVFISQAITFCSYNIVHEQGFWGMVNVIQAFNHNPSQFCISWWTFIATT